MQSPPREWLASASQGDTVAFEKVYGATCDYVYTLAVRITGNRADAEEVVQDVYLKVFRDLGGFRHESSFTTWLYRITVNRAISALRKSKRRRERQVEYDDSCEVADGGDGAREAIEREGNEARVRSLLESLNPDQRACIVLREIQGLRYKEIAEVLGININTVRSRLKRAREFLIALGRDAGRSGDGL